MAEDVTVRCRVRKLSSNVINGDGTINIRTVSPRKLNNNVDNAATIIEMTCTMRNWDTSQHQQSSSRNMMLRNAFSLSNPDMATADTNTMSESSSKMFHSDSAIDMRDTNGINSKSQLPTGPELLFTPTYDVSPSKSTRLHVSRRISPVSLQPYSIPVNEILLVTYDIANKSDHERTVSHTKMHITTLSLGHYDVDCVTSNGHDIVLAFLQASLPQERMVRDESRSSSKSPRNTKKKSKRKASVSNNFSNKHDADEIAEIIPAAVVGHGVNRDIGHEQGHNERDREDEAVPHAEQETGGGRGGGDGRVGLGRGAGGERKRRGGDR